MTVRREQLEIQLDRLEQTFGDKAFSEQRALMIWNAVSHLDYQSVIGIVDGFIRSSKFAPLPQEFFEAAKGYEAQSKNYSLGECVPREIARCLDCGDSGFAPVVRRHEFEAWALWESGSAPCHCSRGAEMLEAGKRRKPKPIDFGSQFNDRWKLSYSISPVYGGSA